MTKEELSEAWERFYRDRDAESKRKLAEHYYNFVVIIARKMAKKLNYKVEADELASHGVSGLYKAIDSFEQDRKIKFETYAYNRIRGSMLDGIRSEDWIPRGVRIRASKLDDLRCKLEGKKGDRVTENDVINASDYGQDMLTTVKKFKPVAISSIDAFAEANFDETHEDHNPCLISKNVSSPDAKILRKEFFSKLLGKSFTPLERKVIYLYYYEELTMGEISSRLNISESRISQVHQEALERMRTKISINPHYFEEEVVDELKGCNDSGSLF
jgi:RNA polymerase sigma factor for flagellar operon FliA